MASAKEYFREKQNGMYSEEYTKNLEQHRRKIFGVLTVGIAVLILGSVLLYYYNSNRVYRRYEIVKETECNHNDGSHYAMMGEQLICYNMDGISCYDADQNVLWNQSYEMKKPMIAVCSKYTAVCDTNGTKFYVLGLEGVKGEVETQLPIKRIAVADQGVVAVLLEDGDISRIHYYDRMGTLLAENKSPADTNGFPMDISLSEDGMKMAVSYLTLETGSVKTKAAFYNFDTVGANEIDHLVSAQQYENAVVPEIAFVNTTTAVVFGDSFFDIFQGSEKPVQQKKVEFQDKIKSIFYNESYIGVVLENSGENPSILKVFDLRGEEKLSMPFKMHYEQAKICDDMVYLISHAQCAVYNLRGRLKFEGNFGEDLRDVLPLAEDRMVFVLNDSIQTVRLK